ncbi:Nucleolar protein nop5 [Oopsacas minuta]|uniref:Nucleolar protein nop5 n=1 Tax=Oopsacas minuta TaxID=111878 RepID=A0AAV7JD14_9METZ|nr:Nucleolar protein nop5 [Oopsacas minuta]
MLILFETAAGYAIFKLLDEKKLQESDNIFKEFESPDTATQLLKLQHFEKFADVTEALTAATAVVEGKLTKRLKKVITSVSKGMNDSFAVADPKLGSAIKEKVGLECIHGTKVQALMRGIREQSEALLVGLDKKEMETMAMSLAHGMSRFKLKFSPDKVDTMIIQAVNLLDDLDKELNNYIMRCREWYGWHFPELGKIVTDHTAYVRSILSIGMRVEAKNAELDGILPVEIKEEVVTGSEVSMGTEIAQEDLINIQHLCRQVLELTAYREQLSEYLTNRMATIAPNLTVLVGELVGARLIAHAGSLINLAKYPASTVQILGAEKALFRALKGKKNTPKYGLLYHASLVGQSSNKFRGKISRSLAAKASISARVDALGEGEDNSVGLLNRQKVEARLRECEKQQLRQVSGTGKGHRDTKKFEFKKEHKKYDSGADFMFDDSGQSKTPTPGKKRKIDTSEDPVDMEIVPGGGEGSEKRKKKKKHQD